MQLAIDLKPGEKELFIFKTSPYALRDKIYLTIIGVFLTLWGIVGSFSPLVKLAAFVFLVLTIGYASYHWLLWSISNSVLTNKRLIKIDQKSLFNKAVQELQLDRILDITYEQKGMAANMAHYGTLHVIGIGLTIDIYHVAHPAKARDMILDARPSDKRNLSNELISLVNNK
jgi:hypothetical protein